MFKWDDLAVELAIRTGHSYNESLYALKIHGGNYIDAYQWLVMK